MPKLPQHAALAALLFCLVSACPALAAPRSEPSPPCGSPAWPSSAPVGSPPSIASWTLTQLPRDWALPACVGWELQRYGSFVAVVGTFHAAGMQALLNRLAAISSFKGLRYWSVTDRRLEVLITDAYAVAGPADDNKRPDFRPAELELGRDLYFAQRDNRSSGPVLNRMRVVENTRDRLVVDIENASKVRRFLLTLFDAGDLRTVLFISRTAEDTWTCYALLGFHPTALAELFDNPKSHINRLVALYGHVAGSDDSALPWAQ